jgi:hypothetical protein
VAGLGFVAGHRPHWSEVAVDRLGAGDRVEHRNGAVNLGVAEAGGDKQFADAFAARCVDCAQ